MRYIFCYFLLSSNSDRVLWHAKKNKNKNKKNEENENENAFELK
jgi:hypothetical protein